MIVKHLQDVPATRVDEPGVLDVQRKILIGPEDGSENIVLRLFKLMPGGHTPRHRHDFEHVVKVESGQGIVVDEEGREISLKPGQSLFIPENSLHQFRNPSAEPFEFLCIVLNPEALK